MANKRPEMPQADFLQDRGLSSAMLASLDDLTRNTEAEAARDTDFEAVMHNTSSSNPGRPRTISAGYDSAAQKLTVVFRDGTWYEYRNVSPEVWQGFQAATSKSAYLETSGLNASKDRGPVNMATMSKSQRVQMSSISDFADYLYSSKKE
jgi:hypothetical protein